MYLPSSLNPKHDTPISPGPNSGNWEAMGLCARAGAWAAAAALAAELQNRLPVRLTPTVSGLGSPIRRFWGLTSRARPAPLFGGEGLKGRPRIPSEALQQPTKKQGLGLSISQRRPELRIHTAAQKTLLD